MSLQSDSSILSVSTKELKSYCDISESGCWEWSKSIHTNGYGMFHRNKERIYAHRLMWMIYNKRILNRNEFVCHKCDNPKCINPKHLFLGRSLDNVRDMHKKGRNKIARVNGSKNGNSKLTEDQVIEIRKLLNTEDTSSIADRFSVSDLCIKDIKFKRTWRHLK